MILIVEDDQDIAAALRDALSDEGFSSTVVSSVAEANARFEAIDPMMILLDWRLPDGTGEDVVRAIRPKNSSIPIVVMSAAREALTASWAIEARDRLAKPLDVERLVSLARRYCR